MTEALGWAASGLVIVSLMATSVVRLRVIGLAASAVFIAYSVLIEAWPIVITNAAVAVIHLWRLRGLLDPDEYFDVLPVQPDSAYLAYFCEFYADDIRRFVPDYSYRPVEGQTAVFVLRNMVPAGVFVGVRCGDTVEVLLDYVIPRYRDFKVGRFLYSPASGVFTDAEVRRVRAGARTPRHRAYLQRMGFRSEDGAWVREVPSG